MSRFDGRLVTPLSLWMSVAVPPAVAFRTDVLRRSLPLWDFDCPLYMERILLAELAAEGEVAAEPWIAATAREHAQQGCQVIHDLDNTSYPRQWLRLINRLNALVKRRALVWEPPFRALLAQVAETHRARWLTESQSWPADDPLCRQVRSVLLESLNTDVGAPINRRPVETNHSGRFAPLKDWARDFTPPLLWRLARRAMRRKGKTRP